MNHKLILFFTILAYSMVASQSYMHSITLKNIQLNLSANSYIEFRKLMDNNMSSGFKYIMYLTLLFNLLLIVSNRSNMQSFIFITSCIAFAALIIDIIIAIKINIPINDIINTWSHNNYPNDWTNYRDKWMYAFQYRQLANISGFVSLLLGAIYGLKYSL